MATLPSCLALNVLTKMGHIKFITSDIVAVVEEPNMDPDAFQVLQSAHLVGDPKEVHTPSLQWRSVWVKVSCKHPSKIGGATEVFINKQGRKISWFFSEKLKQHPRTQPDEDWGPEDDEVTDEKDPESQENHGRLETGQPSPQGPPKPNEAGPSDYQGKKKSTGDYPTLEEVLSASLEVSLTEDGVIHQCKESGKHVVMAQASETPIQDSDPSSGTTNEEMSDSTKSAAQIHDCQKWMGFSDILQEMNEMAIKLNFIHQDKPIAEAPRSPILVQESKETELDNVVQSSDLDKVINP